MITFERMDNSYPNRCCKPSLLWKVGRRRHSGSGPLGEDCLGASLKLHFNRYHEILCRLSTNRFEDCLMEYQAQGGDGIDLGAGQPCSFIRHCTICHGRFNKVDALDMGEFGTTGEPSRGVLIDGCLIYDFVDKGISMRVRVDVTVTNCLRHHLDSVSLISVQSLGANGVVRFWADPERSYSLLASDDAAQGGSWSRIADVFSASVLRRVAITNRVSAAAQFYGLVSPRLP